MIILGASSEMRGALCEAEVPERTMIESAIPCQPTNGSVRVLRQVALEGHPIGVKWAGFGGFAYDVRAFCIWVGARCRAGTGGATPP